MSDTGDYFSMDGDSSGESPETFTVRDFVAELLPYSCAYDPTTSVYGMDRFPANIQGLLETPLTVSRHAAELGSARYNALVPSKKDGVFSSMISFLKGGKKAQKNAISGGPNKGKKRRGGGRWKAKGKGDEDPYTNVPLADVGGLEDQVGWLQDAVLSHLTDELQLKDFGIAPPKGILFYGPPGTGKTLLARAFGNELSKLTGKKVSFFHHRGPDCYTPKFGESEEIIREMFAEAEKSKPSIIFFDELDGLCPSRKGTIGEAATSVVTTLLGCMDSLPVGEVFVFGATNLIDSVDPAMIRPGRFDKHLEFFPPSFEGRKKIIEIHTKKWKRSQPTGKKLEEMALKTQGFTGADLEMLARQAVTSAVERTVPTLKNFNSKAKKDFKNMVVTDEDWATAFKLVKPSPPAFNSPVYIPLLPNPSINPLVKHYQEFILENLVPRLPKDTETAEEDKGPTHSSVYHINSVLIVDEEEDNLERYVLPGIFSHSEVSKIPAYFLSSQRLHASLCSSLDFLNKTFNTVFNYGKACILYIQMIDVIIDEHPDLLQPLAYNLQLLKGKDVLLLATSTKDYLELPNDYDFRNLFSKCTIYSVTPLQSETRVFLRSVLKEATKDIASNSQDEQKVKKLIDEATLRLKDATILEHVNFVDNLLTIIDHEQKSRQIEKLTDSIKEFQFRESLFQDP